MHRRCAVVDSDEVTPTAITAHLDHCPEPGDVPLLVINGDADFSDAGNAITYGQVTSFEGLKVTP